MKTILGSRKDQRGSVLVVSLIVTFILGVTLASYLLMTRGQNVSVVRSQTWNSAFAITEAGIEDALAMMNKNGGNLDGLRDWTNAASLTADNWTTLSSNLYHARRYIGSNYYDVYITNINNAPTIHSMGTIAWNHSYASAPQGFLAAVSVSSPSATTYLRRKVDVQTRVDAIFAFSMGAERTIDLNGKRVETDSFDSADPDYSTNGLYTVSKSRDHGDVVTNDIVDDALDVGNGKIRGVVKTGPKGTIEIGPNGSVGDKAWVDGGSTGIQTGHSADDMNVVWDPVTLPTDASWVPATATASVLVNYTTNGTMYDYVFLQSGDYFISTFNRGLYVSPNVNVRLWITGNVDMTGAGEQIYIGAVGASLKIYMQGATFRIGGNGVVNASANAANFYYYGLPTNTQLQFIGNTPFIGSIYAPNAFFQLGGGGSDDIDFIGSSVTRRIQMNGHYKFHFDENLKRVGPGRGYIPTNWKES